ncbi:MAG: ABC transporter substrate-binding protein [Acidimicrobiia bacterium]
MRKTYPALLVALVAGSTIGPPDAEPPTPAPVTSEAAGPTTTPPSPTTASFPVTVLAANGAVEIPTLPERIVSLSATHTEVLFAIGAGDQVVAVDLFSDFPPEARERQQIDAFQLNVEAVAVLDPDLVVLAFDPGEAVTAFQALEIPALLFDAPADLEAAYAQWEVLGAATGHVAEAAEAVAEVQHRIDQAVASVPAPEEPITYYHELDPSYFTVTSSTFVGRVYGLFGLESIADGADPDGTGFPQLSGEAIVAADPDVIFLADTLCCGQSPETVAARPGWDTLTAVREGRVVPLGDDVASRWGPRLADLAEVVAAAVIQQSVPVR